MDRKRRNSETSSFIENINESIFADSVGDAEIGKPPPKKKFNTGISSESLRVIVQEHKERLFRNYQLEFAEKKDKDDAWTWLSALGIPCHNASVPIAPHTKAQVPRGCRTAEDVMKNLKANGRSYQANSITPEILSRYCDWRIEGTLPSFVGNEDNALYTYRNAAKKASFGGADRPEYEERPSRVDSTKSIHRYVLRTLRSFVVKFNGPVLHIPKEWSEVDIREDENLKPYFWQIPAPSFWSLPPLYKEMLAKMSSTNGNATEGSSPYQREPSRPLDQLEDSELLNILENRGDDNADLLVSATERLFEEYLPVGEGMPQETAYGNARRASQLVDRLNQSCTLNASRREAASKLGATFFRQDKAVAFIPSQKVTALDDTCGLGSVLVNDEPYVLEHHTASIIVDWVNQPTVRPKKTEMGDEKGVGPLLNKLVWSGEINITEAFSLSLPSCLQMAGTHPEPDLCCQAEGMGSSPSLATCSPVVFAGECKRTGQLTRNTAAQLACALNGTLVLLVLMYLDMRKAASDALPEWLFVYGIIYTGSGVIIRAHFPTYRYTGEEEDTDTEGEVESSGKHQRTAGGNEDINSWSDTPSGRKVHLGGKQKLGAVHAGLPRWIFRSAEVTARYSTVFKSDKPVDRIRLLSALLMVRSHSLLLLEKFKAWAGEPSDTSAFSAFHSLVADKHLV